MAEVYLASLAIQIEPLGNSVQACTQCEICRTADSFSVDKRLGKLEIQTSQAMPSSIESARSVEASDARVPLTSTTGFPPDTTAIRFVTNSFKLRSAANSSRWMACATAGGASVIIALVNSWIVLLEI